MNCKDSNWLIECSCGLCDEVIFLRNKSKGLVRFKFGHHKVGKNNYRWKGEERIDNNGYVLVSVKNHYSGKTRVLKHRLVYEEYYNVCLLPLVEIDHIIPIKEGGTNDIKNLRPMIKSDHRKRHMKGNNYGKNKRIDMSDRRCSICESDNLDYIRKDTNSPQWFGNKKDGWKCLKCNRKQYYEKNKYRFWLK